MSSLHSQLKKRRTALGLKQSDMLMRAGISRQQYQQIESKGNPRLNTLDLLAQGLQCELMLIPKDKVAQVQAILEGIVLDSAEPSHTIIGSDSLSNGTQHPMDYKDLIDNPWRDILGESD